ncbi:ATP-binding cassette domain-containing protein [Komagataeibacter melomenusus]
MPGPNGSGKSTLLRAMAGLGADVLTCLTLAARTRRCLYLLQALPAMMHLPVLESMLAARHAIGIVPADAQGDEIDAALHLLDVFGIADLDLRYMDELSGG